MLVNLKEILCYAEENKKAIAAFNAPNYQTLVAVVQAAEELDVPVIVSHAQVHEGLISIDQIGPLMLNIANKATVPVCVHLDHGTDIEYLYKAMKIGFTSVMYDGSALSFEENIKNTCQVVRVAKEKGVSVEAELGKLSTGETGEKIIEDASSSMYTDPIEAKEFVEVTGIDALAASFGTAHGIYSLEPKLDFDRVRQIYQNTNVPIVMHGGSGLNEEDYKKAIENGVRKINYYTYMALAGGKVVKDKIANLQGALYYHDIALWAEEAMKKDALKVMQLFTK